MQLRFICLYPLFLNKLSSILDGHFFSISIHLLFWVVIGVGRRRRIYSIRIRKFWQINHNMFLTSDFSVLSSNFSRTKNQCVIAAVISRHMDCRMAARTYLSQYMKCKFMLLYSSKSSKYRSISVVSRAVPYLL